MSVWDKLIDQLQISQDLINYAKSSNENGTINHHAMANSWLFLGDTSYNTNLGSLAFACQLLCETQNACGQCSKCVSILKNEHPDVFILRTNKVSIKIDDLRNATTQANIKPRHGKYRIMIIEDASRIDGTTQDVLLKSIEEPPEHTIWILIAKFKQDLLPTIASRSRIIQFKTPSLESIANFLISNYQVEKNTADICASLCLSNIESAIDISTKPKLLEERQTLAKIPLYIKSAPDVLLATNKIFSLLDFRLDELENKTDKDETRRIQKDFLNMTLQIFLEVFRDAYFLKHSLVNSSVNSLSSDIQINTFEKSIVNKHILNILKSNVNKLSFNKLNIITNQINNSIRLVNNSNVNLKLLLMSLLSYMI